MAFPWGISMNFLKAATEKFRTIALGHLSPDETRRVQDAYDLLLNGWPGVDDDFAKFPDILKAQRARETIIRELSSGDPARQRATLQIQALEDLLAAERTCNERLRSMLYFKGMSAATPLNLKVARQICKSDIKEYWALNLPQKLGEDARKAAFPDIEDDHKRKEIGSFCWHFLSELRALLLYFPHKLDDGVLKASLLDSYRKSMSNLPEQEFLRSLRAMESVASASLPERLKCYAELLREPAFIEQLKTAWRTVEDEREAESDRLAAEEKAEAERKAAEKRKRIQEQLSFKVEGETLDISMYGWPRLADPADELTLFDNLKAAFARATTLRLVYRPEFGDQFRVERSIRSMSLRQLACTKNLVWADRIGLQTKRELGDLARFYVQRILELLNADGHASIQIRDGEAYDWKPLDSELAAEWRVDVDDIWFKYADSFQKWIDTDTFAGELARWVVEDPGESTGWATSR